MTMIENEVEPLSVALAAGRAVAVPLTKGHVAYVDAEDYDRVVAAGPWKAWDQRPRRDLVYAVTTGGTLLHRLVLGLGKGRSNPVDHANGDALDNRKANLRAATPQENAKNTGARSGGRSKFKGVCYRTATPGVWYAEIRLGRNGFLYAARFATEEEAARARDNWVRANSTQPEFETYNFPLPGERSAL